ncbi:MAG: lipid-A-disaccharide synthase [Puniceicoccales bacterium]|jgi:lipid-A-disaccharide synthase|nr:lipid-A-disaccharide synthase [Puniceicoccales bacterium]
MQKIEFNEITAEYPDLLVIAGEYSGDEHGAALVKKLKIEYPQYSICAIGGNNLERTGVDFLFNLVEFSVVGIAEALRNIQFFLKILKMICDWITKYRPKVVCFIDFPGLNLHIAKELYQRGISHKAGGNVKLYHYISPQIWAWKAKRRFVIAKYIDALGTIFPFEKACYGDTNLDVQFLGHPFLDEGYALPVNYNPNGPILLLPGSRKIAVKKIFPIMLNTINQLKKFGETCELVALYPDEDILEVSQNIYKKHKNLSLSFVRSGACTLSACASLMSSGTMALNCALAGIPSVIVYKASTLTYGLAKLLVKVKFLHIANILLNRESAREFLQFSAKPKLICHALRDCLNNPEVLAQAQKDKEELRQLLSSDPQNDAISWIRGAFGLRAARP